MQDINLLCRRINYKFNDIEILKLALTHRSKRKSHNERLEFLGDAILGYIIAEYLYNQFPLAQEGELSYLRTTLVNGETLAEMAMEFNLSQYLIMGVGELKSGGYLRGRILEDAFEALIGAIYLDSNMEMVKQCILNWYKTRLASLSVTKITKDPKTELQEYLHKNNIALPSYELIKIEGQDHQQTIHVSCVIEEINKTIYSFANTRKFAEQLAAKEMLKDIMENDTKEQNSKNGET